jgi:hypothetical protein
MLHLAQTVRFPSPGPAVVSFGRLQLNLILVNRESVSTTPATMLDLGIVPDLDVHLHIAVGKRYGNKLHLRKTSARYPV